MGSELNKFYEKPWAERIEVLAKECGLGAGERKLLESLKPLGFETADRLSENVIGVFGLPFGVATNFRINGQDFIIPMVTEESSVVAAASNGAKQARKAGGFTAECERQEMIGQVVLQNAAKDAGEKILAEKDSLIEKATNVDQVLKKLGGGAVDIEVHAYDGFLEVHLIVNVLDAMGANAVNSMCEALVPELEKLGGGKALMGIISNYAVRRIAKARGTWLKEDLGEETIERIIKAAGFADKSVYRAATHNKGIMNGLAALAIATGNDFRAVGAGAHAYAARDGQYGSLTRYWKDREGNLCGEIELPLQVGIVGGSTRVNPMARLGLKILGVKSAKELCECFAAVGLAQNFAAVRAIVKEGIQCGHMKLHAENIAVQAGAEGKKIKEIAGLMVKSGKINEAEARKLLGEKK